MKFVLFDVDNPKIGSLLSSDMTELSDEECIELANEDGMIFNSIEDFQADFNGEMFSTATHQLRIIDDAK